MTSSLSFPLLSLIFLQLTEGRVGGGRLLGLYTCDRKIRLNKPIHVFFRNLSIYFSSVFLIIIISTLFLWIDFIQITAIR